MIRERLFNLLQEGNLEEIREYQNLFYLKGTTVPEGKAFRRITDRTPVEEVRRVLETTGVKDYLIESIPSRLTLYEPSPQLIGIEGWTIVVKPLLSDLARKAFRIIRDNSETVTTNRSRYRYSESKPDYARLTVLGSGREVGRSCNYLESQQEGILVDCGLGFGTNPLPYIEKVDLETLRGVFVTHAHYDHVGGVPLLFRKGYRGPVYGTAASLIRCVDTWYTYLRITSKPLYSEEDVIAAVTSYVILEKGVQYPGLLGNSTITLLPSGHMPGSVFVSVIMNTPSRPKKILFTGDVGQFKTTVYDLERNVGFYDVMVSEATYGGSAFSEKLPGQLETLREAIKTSLDKGGKVMIATLEQRATEVYYYLKKVTDFKKVSLGKGVRETMICDNDTPEEYRAQLRSEIMAALKGAEEASLVREDIHLTSPGMLEGGDSLETLKLLSKDPANLIVLTSFMPATTVGRNLLDKPLSIRFKVGLREEVIRCHASVLAMNGFSAHASGQSLADFIKKHTRMVVLQHGSNQAITALARQIGSGTRIVRPKNLESYRL